MTIQEIKTAAEKLGFKTEEREKEIGVEMEPYCWSWWEKFSTDYAFYHSTYSQRTGKVCKNLRRGMRKEQKLENAI